MSDSNLDIAWKETELVWLRGAIDTEIDHVNQVLERVADVCGSDPAEDDTILVGIQKVGEDMRTKWTDMCGTFKEISNKIQDIFTNYHNTGQKFGDQADNMSRSL